MIVVRTAEIHFRSFASNSDCAEPLLVWFVRIARLCLRHQKPPNNWAGSPLARIDSLNLRTKRVVAFVIGAVILAAVLRHGFHVYAGYSRPEIAVGALIALEAAMLAFLLLRKTLARLRLRPTRRVRKVAPIAGFMTSVGRTKLK